MRLLQVLATSRIDNAVQQICQNIDQNKKRRRNQYRTHHHGKIEFFQCIYGYLADTFPSKNIFNKKSAGQQFSKPAGNGGNNRV